VGNDVTIGARYSHASNHGGIVGFCNNATIEGCTSAATITDYVRYSEHYGGIVGFCQGNSTVKDCLYTGPTFNNYYNTIGAIAGDCGTNGTITLTNNYYTNADINFGGVNGNDVDGARRGYTITLQNENIAFIGTQTTYNASGLTAIGESVLCYNDGTTTTYYSGEGQTVTLDYTGSISSGERLIYSVNGTPIEGNSFEMPAQDVAVTAVVQARYTFDSSTGADTRLGRVQQVQQVGQRCHSIGGHKRHRHRRGELHGRLLQPVLRFRALHEHGPEQCQYQRSYQY
jgi:hypothetical protein